MKWMNMMNGRKRYRLSDISLKVQLVCSFLAVTLLVLSASSYYIYGTTLNIQQKRTEEMSLAQFRQIETNIHSLLREVDKLSKTFLWESKVQAFLEEEEILDNADFIPYVQEITDLITQYIGNYEYLESIYIFSDNGVVLGGSIAQNQSTAVLGKEYPFYSTELYENVKKNYPNPLWIGGVTSVDFMRNPLAHETMNENLISLIRGGKPIRDMKMNAELAINIKESYLKSIYSRLASIPSGSISIIDDNGQVISSTLQDTIGRPDKFSKQIPTQSQYGSFSAYRENISQQVIYYRMNEPGWVLVDEVPTELYMKDIAAIQHYIIGIFVLSIVLIIAFSTLWTNRIMKSFQQLIRGMRHVGRGHVGMTLPKASNKEMSLLIEQFNTMSNGILELMTKNEEAEKEKRQLEIEALQSQINPHFLFNTLNTVKWMAAVANAPNIVDCMTNLGNMLRPIYYQPTLLWSIEEEISFVKHYVNIMNYRFGEEVTFQFHVSEDCMNYQTLQFIIQPLVENALTHGKLNHSVIQISVMESKGDIVLTVEDTNGGMPLDKVEEINRMLLSETAEANSMRGFGLYNVNKRIRLHFGVQFGVMLESQVDHGTKVSIHIPKILEAKQSIGPKNVE
jgi:two-component system sensor histidine kinase YesM